MTNLSVKKYIPRGNKRFLRLIVALIIFSFGGVHTAFGQKQIVWYSMQKAQKLAKNNHKKVLIYAGASWCGYCKKMDQQVLPKPKVVDSLTTYFYGVRLDIESKRPILFNGKKMTQFQFARKHGVRATPTFFFLSSNGRIIGAQPGFMPADIFSQLLGYVGSDAYQKMEFSVYLNKRVNGDEE